MIDREEPKLSLVRQCALLGISRSSLYYLPTEAGAEDLELMALIDQQYLKTPFYGSRRMTAWLSNHGHQVNRKRVRRLMQLIGLEAIYRRPNTSKPNPGHKVYPYLLRGLEINRVNQVWATDITYIPMARGFLYLVAIMDWHSRYVLAWRLSNTLEVDFCVAALEEALSKGRPQIFNTDQGSQFTSEAFTSMLLAQAVQVSMDGRGRCMDNVFVERLWRSIKYEEVYLKAYQNGTEARKGIGAYLAFYNQERPHQALGYRSPGQVFHAVSPQRCLLGHPQALQSDEGLARIHRRTPMDGVRKAEGGGEGATGEIAWVPFGVGRSADGLHRRTGAPMAVCGSCDARDGERIRSRELSRTGLARVCGDLRLSGGWVADGAVRPGVEWLAAGPRRG